MGERKIGGELVIGREMERQLIVGKRKMDGRRVRRRKMEGELGKKVGKCMSHKKTANAENLLHKP